MSTSALKPRGTVTLSSRLGATGVKSQPPAPRALTAAAASDAWPAATPVSVSAPAPTAAVLISERRARAVAAISRNLGLSVVFGIGWSQALPQRKWQVMWLREPWRTSVWSGRRRRVGVMVIDPPEEWVVLAASWRQGRNR